MFATNNLAATAMMVVPDICNTPIVVPVPLPYPNITESVTHVPSQFNVLMGPGLGENLLTKGTISQGDDIGVEMGLLSGEFMGPDQYYLGSFTVLVGGIPAARLTSVMGMNGELLPNTAGISLTPAQVSVLLLG